MADPYFNQPGEVDIPLSVEYYFELMQNEKIELSIGLPTFLNTSLGWVVSSKVSKADIEAANHKALNDVIELQRVKGNGP